MTIDPKQGIIGSMKLQQNSVIPSTVVPDEPVLTDEELKRLAIVFDVLIDVDFYLNYTQEAVVS